MQLSDGERLIVAMLADLMTRVGGEGEIAPDFVMSALPNHGWALKRKYPHIFTDEPDQESVVAEVSAIMDMYRGIEDSLAALPAGEAEQFADSYYARFRGFDGNEEIDHYSVANFLIDKLDLFQEFAGRSLNSHMPMLERYRSMLFAFEGERRAGAPGNRLSTDQLRRLLAAD
jgi:uncharacterized protein